VNCPRVSGAKLDANVKLVIRMREIALKNKLWGAVAASVLMLCAAPAASAKVMVATYTGAVSYMFGDSSLFGSTTGVGSAFDLTFKYDTDVGQLTDNLPDEISLLGGSTSFPAGPSPMRAAAIRIDGVRRGFTPEAAGFIDLDFANGGIFHGASACPLLCEAFSADFHPDAMPASLSSAFEGAGTGQGNFTLIRDGRAVFAYVALQRLSISAAPEPAVWLSLVGGLFGAGSILRRQRRRVLPATA
jgi:hypothetical protein